MPRVLDPFRFLLIAVAGWMNQHQLQAIDYLREENRVLREQLGPRRLRLNDDQRRRLAAAGISSTCGRRSAASARHFRTWPPTELSLRNYWVSPGSRGRTAAPLTARRA